MTLAALCRGLFRRTHVGVGFDVAPLLFHNATQLALHGFERVVDDFFERFVSAVIHLPFIGHKLVARCHGHVDPAPVWVPFLMGEGTKNLGCGIPFKFAATIGND